MDTKAKELNERTNKILDILFGVTPNEKIKGKVVSSSQISAAIETLTLAIAKIFRMMTTNSILTEKATKEGMDTTREAMRIYYDSLKEGER